MKKIIFIVFCFLLCGGRTSTAGFTIKVKIKNRDIASIVGFARVNVMTGNKSFKINVYDENGKKCNLTGVNRREDITEVFFNTTNSETYTLNFQNGDVLYPEFKNGEIIIDDYVPPESIKAGFWQWEENAISGIYSHTDKEGFSFHRVSFPSEFLIKSNDKLVCFLYIDAEKSPEEILVEIGTRYRRSYFFSFGKDIIKWKGLEKIHLGDVPEKGKWVKIEIPFRYLKENSLKAIGFYHNKGKVIWDRISIGDVACGCKIIKYEKDKSPVSAYFNYEIKGPFKIKDKKISFLHLDASPSKGENFLWNINGKNYTGKKLNLSFEIEKIKVNLKVEKDRKENEISHTFDISKMPVRDIKLNVKIFPHSDFIRESEKLYIPFRIENMSDIPLDLYVSFNSIKEKEHILPGKENGKNFTYGIDTGKAENSFLVEMDSLKISEKKIKLVSPEYKFIISGPFLKDIEGNYLIIKLTDFRIQKKELPKNFRVVLLGEYPEVMKNIFEKNFEKVEGEKEPIHTFKNRLLSEISYIRNIKNLDEKDIVFFFPSFEGILRTFPDEWSKGMETIIYLLSKKTAFIYIVFPYITPDGSLSSFRKESKKICNGKGVYFIDFRDIFKNDWKKYYTISNNLFSPIPNKKGCEIIAENLFSILKK